MVARPRPVLLHTEQPSGGAEGRSSTWDLGSRQRVGLQPPGKGLV